MSERLTGVIREYNAAGGFGFVVPDDGRTAAIFVHVSNLTGDGPRQFTAGERIAFALGRDRQGRQKAVRVERVAAAPAEEPSPYADAPGEPAPQMYEARGE